MRYEKMEQERQDREDELREMAIKLRRRYDPITSGRNFVFRLL